MASPNSVTRPAPQTRRAGRSTTSFRKIAFSSVASTKIGMGRASCLPIQSLHLGCQEGRHVSPARHWIKSTRRRRRSASGSHASITERATVATRLTDLETAERVLTRVGKTPPARRTTSAAAEEAKASAASRGRARPPKSVASKSAARKPSAPRLGERILALATGRTRQELYLACPSDRPNHVGIAVQRHLRAGRIQERDGKLYAISPTAQRAHAASRTDVR